MIVDGQLIAFGIDGRICRDDDTQLRQLVGISSYAVTFPKGQLPPVKGL